MDEDFKEGCILAQNLLARRVAVLEERLNALSEQNAAMIRRIHQLEQKRG